MRKLIFILFLGLSNMLAYSQSHMEGVSFVSDDYIEKWADVPVIRSINGGTVFKIKYEGEWSNDMKGAFEYACKIWEEQMPPCLPIKITAEVGELWNSIDSNAISEFYILANKFNDGFNDYRRTPIISMKGILLMEYNNNNSIQFINDPEYPKYLDTDSDEYDIKITYSKKILEECYFTLEPTTWEDYDKYDFVSIVLRDLAHCIGFNCPLLENTDSAVKQLSNFERDKFTYFHNLVYNALGTSDPVQAYQNATKGTIPLTIEDYGTLNLYAPNPWQDYVSLNYFVVPTGGRGLPFVLSPLFGRGSMVRDITDPGYLALFKNALGWKTYHATGSNSLRVNLAGSTDSVIPYKGSIFMSGSSSRARSFSYQEEIPVAATIKPSMVAASAADDDNYEDFLFSEYMTPYHHFYRPEYGKDGRGWSVSLLKKDGTWDVVYDNWDYWKDLDITSSDMVFHCENEEYARTCDGYLRGRITHATHEDSYYGGYDVYDVTFAALDYVPQKPHMAFDGVVETPQARKMSVAQADYDEYLRDVKIGIKNLEGTDRIIVEQLIEGDRIPTKFEVEDFKKGYFIATVDKEFYSWFTIVAENKNGSVRSETLEIAPLEPAEEYSFDVKISDETITIAGNNRRLYERNGLARYEIAPLSGIATTASLAGEIEENRAEISIADLPGGVYALNYYDRRGTRYSQKFVKRAR